MGRRRRGKTEAGAEILEREQATTSAKASMESLSYLPSLSGWSWGTGSLMSTVGRNVPGGHQTTCSPGLQWLPHLC